MWYWILKHDTFWVLNAQHVSVQCVRPPLTFQSGSYYLQGNSVIIVFTVFRDIFLYCYKCFSVWTFFISVTYHISTPPLNPPPPPHTNIPINRWHTTYVSLARSSRGSRMSDCVRGLLTLRLRKLSEWGKMGSLQGHALMPDQYFFIWALYVSIIGPSPTVSPRSSLQTCRIGSQQHYARPPPQAHPPLLSAHHADTYSQPPNLWWWRTHCTVCDSLSE